MSCTVMYQPYAMTSYSNCDRPAPEKKSFRFPYVPSPPDSLHSDGSSYSSPGPSSGGTTSSSASQPNTGHSHRRPLTPSCGGGGASGGISGLSLSSAPATITSASQINSARSPPSAHHNSSSSSNSSNTRHLSHGLGTGNPPQSHQRSSASSTSTSQSHLLLGGVGGGDENETPGGGGGGGSSSGGAPSEPGGSRAQYLSANCVVYENYRGDAARVVEEHFSRALSAPYSNDKASKIGSPMSTRNFPPSFWNSNYQPSKPLVSYGPSDFYGAAVDYGPSLSGLTHHHQTDPWHYPLASHQGYHHRPTDLSYPPMPSTSRFNAAQYGSFLLAGAAATSSAASRFSGMPGSSQCGVKGDGPSAWPSGRYHHPHDSLSELHLADYSAAAAAHYSNMTAGLETTVGQESSSKDLYWF